MFSFILNLMEYIEILKTVIELFIAIIGFVPLASETPILLPLAGILAALLWLTQDRKPLS